MTFVTVRRLNTVIDNRGKTYGQLLKERESRRRERIDPSDPFAPTRKYLNITEARDLLDDKGEESVRASD